VADDIKVEVKGLKEVQEKMTQVVKDMRGSLMYGAMSNIDCAT
jgi:hypothetical protein